MAKDARQLREDAAAAASAGKHKRALECYLELERMEPTDAQWPKRVAETYRRLGKTRDAVSAFERAADRYAQNGFLVQAIAVCKLILQIDPTHMDTQQRLAAINAAQGAGPTRIGTLSDNHPSLHENPAVALLRSRRGSGGEEPGGGRVKPPSAPPVVSFVENPGRRPPSQPMGFSGAPSAPTDDLLASDQGDPASKGYARPATPLPYGSSHGNAPSVPFGARDGQSQPIVIERGMPLESVPLGSVMPGSHQQRDDGSQPGILIIPIEPLGYEDSAAIDIEIDDESQRALRSDPAIELEVAELEGHELTPDDEDGGQGYDERDIPLAAPRLVGAAARQALAATPLFAGLNERQLEALISRIDLMTLAPGQILFHEGEHGDSLIVIAEGEVLVEASGPPRVEPIVLSGGAFFGEVTLITDHPRMATVTAQTMVEALRIDRDALAFVVARHPEVVTALLRFVRDRLVERWMRTSPLCRPFTERQRREFASRFRFLEIEAGSTVMAPGDLADGLYIVLAGQFVVRRDGVDAAVLGPGELIGETVLMTGEPLQSSVIAATKCLALWLPVEHFHEVIQIHPHVLEYVGAQAERRRLQIY
jgi:cAMP-dependent protein kinase regulator